MKVALDTNVLAYAEGVNGTTLHDRALRVVSALPRHETVIPTQALGELFNVLVRKARRPRAAARAAIVMWRDSYTVLDTSADNLLAAADLAVEHRLSIWDSVILSVAAEARCRVLLSQDMHSGFIWRGLTVVDPFADRPHPLLSAILGGSD